MRTSKHQRKLNAVIATLACLGWCACGSGDTNGGSGGAGGGGGASAPPSDGSLADAATGTGGVVVGSGGKPSVDAPIGSGGLGQSGGRAGSGGASGGLAGTGGTPGSGGKTGTAGAPLDGGTPGSGGKTAAGGAPLDGGTPGTGGQTGAGGVSLDAADPGSGGKAGTGGQTGAGGGGAIDAGARCGGLAGISCPTGQYCDILDHCHKAGADFAGICVPEGPDVVCAAVDAPVCGCNGKTYPNDCERGAAKVQKFSDGPCAPGRDASAATDEMAYLSWGAIPVGAKTGPGVVVSGIGYYAAATDAPAVTVLLDSGQTPTWSLTNDQIDDLFARLAAVDLSVLPHATSGTSTCKATLEFVTCRTCKKKTLTYSAAAQVTPEMEQLWAWFDQLLGSPTVATNPRTYCSQ